MKPAKQDVFELCDACCGYIGYEECEDDGPWDVFEEATRTGMGVAHDSPPPPPVVDMKDVAWRDGERDAGCWY